MRPFSFAEDARLATDPGAVGTRLLYALAVACATEPGGVWCTTDPGGVCTCSLYDFAEACIAGPDAGDLEGLFM